MRRLFWMVAAIAVASACSAEPEGQCLAAPGCGPGEVEVDSCGDDPECSTNTVCGSTIHCVAVDPAMCEAVTDQATCLDSSCTWLEVGDLSASDGTTCDPQPMGQCFASPSSGANNGICSVWWRDTEVIRINGGSLQDPGWKMCDGSPGEPAACGCATALSCL